MPSRVLETVLTGRNLLSPVLLSAGKDVAAFNAAVAEANTAAGASAAGSAKAQETASAKVVAANTREAESAAASAARQTASKEEAAVASAASARAQETASAKIVAANARSAESAAMFAHATESAAARTGLAWAGLATKALPLVGAALAVVSGKMAGDYQSLVVRLETTAGELHSNLGIVSQGMLDMAGQVGFSATELAKAMYTVEQSMPPAAAGTKRATDALMILKAAAQGARQEQAELPHVVDAVTTSLHDYHLPASEAAHVTSQIVAAISHAKTSFDDFTGAMHSVTPLASSVGISLAQVTGALASMTASGMHADQAAQNLASSIRSFSKPTQPMINQLAQLGLNAQELSAHLGERGVAGTLQLVSDAIVKHMGPAGEVALSAINQNKVALNNLQVMISNMPPEVARLSEGLLDGSESITDYRMAVRDLGGQAGAMGVQFLGLYQSANGFSQIIKTGGPAVQTYIGALGKAVGTAEGLSVALQLTGENAAHANDAIDDISKAAGDAQGNIKGWDEVQHTMNQRLHEAGAAAGALLVSFGQKLLPALTKGFAWIAEDGIPAVRDFGRWLSQLAHQEGVQTLLHGIADGGKAVWTALKDIVAVIAPVATGLGHLFGSLPGPVQAATLAIVAFNLARKAGWFSPAGAAETQAQAGIVRRSMASIGSAATGAATTVQAAAGRMSAAYAEAAAAARLSATIQGESMASANIAGAMAGTTTVARNLATRGFGAISSAGRGLFGLMGGPWGVALLGGIALWSQYSQGVDDVKQSMASAKTSGQELFNTYVKLGTVYGQQAAAARQTVIGQQKWAQAALDNGVSQDTLTLALQGNVKAQQEVEKAAEKSSAKQTFSQGIIGSGLDFLNGKYKENGDAAKEFFNNMGANADAARLFMNSVDDTKGALEDYQEAAQRIFGDGQGMNLANRGVSTLQKGMDELAKSAGSTEASLQGITDILAGLTGKGVSAAKAQADLTTATLDVDAAFKEMTRGAIDPATKAIDLNSKAGADLFNRLQDIGSGYKTAVNEAYSAAGGINNAAEASKAAGAAAQQLYTKFMLTATGAGMSTEAAAELAKQLGLVPGDVVTAFTQPGMTEAQAATRLLQGQVDVLTAGPHDVTVRGLTKQAEDALTAVDIHATHMKDGTVKLTADTYAAQSALDNFIKANAYHEVQLGVRVTYTGTGILKGTGTFGGQANAAGQIMIPMASGGILPAPAGIANVYPPNTPRLIGDNMRVPESFIPQDGSARSQAILAQTAHAMGYGLTQYNPAGTGFEAAAMPGYGPAAAARPIDYERLGAAVARALGGTDGRGGPLVQMNGVTMSSPRDAGRLAQDLAYIGRTRGW